MAKIEQKNAKKGKKCTAFSPPCWSRASESAPSAPNKPKIFQLSLYPVPLKMRAGFFLVWDVECDVRNAPSDVILEPQGDGIQAVRCGM